MNTSSASITVPDTVLPVSFHPLGQVPSIIFSAFWENNSKQNCMAMNTGQVSSTDIVFNTQIFGYFPQAGVFTSFPRKPRIRALRQSQSHFCAGSVALFQHHISDDDNYHALFLNHDTGLIMCRMLIQNYSQMSAILTGLVF